MFYVIDTGSTGSRDLTGSFAGTDAYDMNWAEQGLLNSVFTEGSYVELPFVYNAHMA